MSKKGAVPDAWDDEWESLADKQDALENPQEQRPDVGVSKAQRKAQHAELNRKIWESAENPEPLIFLEAQNKVPLKSTFKPSVTVLSRKPPPKVLSRTGATAGTAGSKLDDDDDSEDERQKQNEESLAGRQARLQREREEKERRYAEARERILGTPIPENSNERSPSRQIRGKGRARGGRDSHSKSRAEQSPVGSGTSRGHQLYDPSYTPKPNSMHVQKQQDSGNSRPGTPNKQSQTIREPRGPQVSGRGGNGFAPRGGRKGPDI